jgi:methylmalonyl-CoA/ethylmalonyl-CoA epimerase
MKDISLGKIAQIAVIVRDLERATAFYRHKLGIKFLFNAPPSMAFFDCDGLRLMLGTAERSDLEHASSDSLFQSR